MIVRCIANTGESLPDANIDPMSGYDRSTEFPLTIGRTYLVVAVTVFLGTAWYYVMDDDDLPWPTWKPSALFDIADGSIPSNWRVGYVRESHDDLWVMSFPEWATDRWFYGRLVDEDPETVAIFERRRAEMEAELKRPMD